MTEYLSAEKLMQHVRALADGIGPRPAGTPREARAHDYVRRALAEFGIDTIETLDFQSPPTWGYAAILPSLLALAGNGLLAGRRGRLLGGLLSLGSAYSLWQLYSGRRPIAGRFVPTGPSATQIVRLPSKRETRHRLVLIGHVDANKDRLTFSPVNKRLLRLGATAHMLFTGLNGLTQLVRAVGSKRALPGLHRMGILGLITAFISHFADEQGGYIDGANDNATAVACLLGLAGHLKANPLDHTEVWLAFTGAEEVGCLGTHALLDRYGDQLKDAYFLDFEMVGAGHLAYVTRHSSFSYFDAYAPDPDSARFVAQTAREHPEFGVTGQPMTIMEEVASLLRRGYRGLCLVGVGADGYLVNWHVASDVSENIEPEKLERAARFALAYAHTLDQQ